MAFNQDIWEHILQYADGETLLNCREVSEEFKEIVNYLSRKKKIWKSIYFEERGNRYPYLVISKLHPHKQALNYPKKWGWIYETVVFLPKAISSSVLIYKSHKRLCDHYGDIVDVETHDDLMLLLIKYNKNFSVYYKVVTVDLYNTIVHKSCKFYTNMIYITPIDDMTSVRKDTILLSCHSCQLAAVPVCTDMSMGKIPKFNKYNQFLTIQHPNNEILWINTFKKFLTKGNCFVTDRNPTYELLRERNSRYLKIYHKYTILVMTHKGVRREFFTYKDMKTNITGSYCYHNLLFLGAESGMLYAYDLPDEFNLNEFDIKGFFWKYYVSSSAILVINVLEQKNEFVVVCCSNKSIYHIHIHRKIRNYDC